GGAKGRVAAVAGDDAWGFDLERAPGATPADARHPTTVADEQAGHVRLHPHGERRKLRGLAREEVEEVPLRHHGDERVALGETAEIRELHPLRAEPPAERLQTLVRALQKGIEQAELVH